MHKSAQVELQLDWPQLPYSEILGPIIVGGSPIPPKKGPLHYFLSYLFSFGSCSVSFFHSENVLCFLSFFTGHGKGLFIAPAVASVLRSCPLTAFVWFGCTCRPHCATPTLARQRRTYFVPLCVVAFLPATILMPSLSTLRACTQWFPRKLPLLGGLSSQQDEPPKRGLGRSCE